MFIMSMEVMLIRHDEGGPVLSERSSGDDGTMFHGVTWASVLTRTRGDAVCEYQQPACCEGKQLYGVNTLLCASSRQVPFSVSPNNKVQHMAGS